MSRPHPGFDDVDDDYVTLFLEVDHDLRLFRSGRWLGTIEYGPGHYPLPDETAVYEPVAVCEVDGDGVMAVMETMAEFEVDPDNWQ